MFLVKNSVHYTATSFFCVRLIGRKAPEDFVYLKLFSVIVESFDFFYVDFTQTSEEKKSLRPIFLSILKEFFFRTCTKK